MQWGVVCLAKVCASTSTPETMPPRQHVKPANVVLPMGEQRARYKRAGRERDRQRHSRHKETQVAGREREGSRRAGRGKWACTEAAKSSYAGSRQVKKGECPHVPVQPH